jgi:hypothetical protein
MSSENTGRRTAFLAAFLRPLAALSLLLLPALSACTTAEGTNAMVDPSTFEREVMTSTLQGLDIVPQDAAKPTGERRAPLVLPKQTAQLPTPTTVNSAALPADSDNPQISTAGLTDADLQHLRNARVVDLRALDGRPLTDIERKQMTARMAAANINVNSNAERPLTLPPEAYFTPYKGRDLVCLAADGTLVTLRDSRCPAAIRNAMKKDLPPATSVDQGINQDIYNATNGNGGSN